MVARLIAILLRYQCDFSALRGEKYVHVHGAEFNKLTRSNRKEKVQEAIKPTVNSVLLW